MPARRWTDEEIEAVNRLATTARALAERIEELAPDVGGTVAALVDMPHHRPGTPRRERDDLWRQMQVERISDMCFRLSRDLDLLNKDALALQRLAMESAAAKGRREDDTWLRRQLEGLGEGPS